MRLDRICVVLVSDSQVRVSLDHRGEIALRITHLRVAGGWLRAPEFGGTGFHVEKCGCRRSLHSCRQKGKQNSMMDRSFMVIIEGKRTYKRFLAFICGCVVVQAVDRCFDRICCRFKVAVYLLNLLVSVQTF